MFPVEFLMRRITKAQKLVLFWCNVEHYDLASVNLWYWRITIYDNFFDLFWIFSKIKEDIILKFATKFIDKVSQFSERKVVSKRKLVIYIDTINIQGCNSFSIQIH